MKKIKKEIEQIAQNLKNAMENESDQNIRYELACRALEAKLLGDYLFDDKKKVYNKKEKR